MENAASNIDILPGDEIQWMRGDAGSSLFGNFGHGLAEMNPMRWSSAKSPSDTILELCQYLTTKKKYAQRPVQVAIKRSGAVVKTTRFETVAAAIAALSLACSQDNHAFAPNGCAVNEHETAASASFPVSSAYVLPAARPTSVQFSSFSNQEASATDGKVFSGNCEDCRRVSDLDVRAQEYALMFQLATLENGKHELDVLANWYFQSFDANRDRKLDMDETRVLVSALCDQLSLPNMDDNLVTEFFRRYDKNRSGLIEENEFGEMFAGIVKKLLGNFNIADKKDILRSRARQPFAQKYKLGPKLSEGAQGVTYLATVRTTGVTVVAKQPKNGVDTADFVKVRDKSHPNIVKVFELFVSHSPRTETFVVMEYCKGGDLFAAIKYCRAEFGGVQVQFCAAALEQTMKGIHYIHQEFKECHNDIKPENVLVDRKPVDINDVPRFMIADFGCSSRCGDNVDGDWRYNAPELWLMHPKFQAAAPELRHPVSFASDVWALGVMMYELLSGGMLIFTDHHNISGWNSWVTYCDGLLFNKLAQRILVPGAQPDFNVLAWHGRRATDLCKKMLAWDWRQRCSLHDALQEPWFASMRKSDAAMPSDCYAHLNQRVERSSMNMVLLNILAAKLQGESLVHYHSMWNEFDTDQDGTLSEKEFVTKLKSYGMEESNAQALYALADVDASRHIDFNEFVAVMFNPDKLDAKELERHMNLIFHDVSGGKESISVADLAAALPDGVSSVRLIEQFFNQIDADGNGFVSQAEFVAYLAKM